MSAREADPDVLIIGAGPTGAVAAKRFVEAGMRVVVLEQGDWPDYSKARADNPDFELTMGRYWSGNPNRRQAAADYPIDDSDSDILAVLCNGVGGGTVIYAAHWQRNRPSDVACARLLELETQFLFYGFPISPWLVSVSP